MIYMTRADSVDSVIGNYSTIVQFDDNNYQQSTLNISKERGCDCVWILMLFHSLDSRYVFQLEQDV